MKCLEQLDLPAFDELDFIEAFPVVHEPTCYAFPETVTASETTCSVTVTYAGPETYNGEFCYAQSPFGLDAYLVVDRMGGPDVAPEAGHTDIAVDAPNGKVYLRSAAWGEVSPMLTKDSIDDFNKSGKRIVIRIPTSEAADKVMAGFISSGVSELKYPYCSTYCAEVLRAGGVDAGRGFTPNSLMKRVKKLVEKMQKDSEKTYGEKCEK